MYDEVLDIYEVIRYNKRCMAVFTFKKTTLHSALTIANQVSQKKSEVDVFTYTRLEFVGDLLIISTLNNAVYFKTTIPIHSNNTQESIVFLIKTESIFNSISILNDEYVTLDVNINKHTVQIQGAKSKHTLRIDTDKINDFVVPDEKPDEIIAKISVNTNELIWANKASFSTVGTPKNIHQNEFLSICYTISPQSSSLKVVSCDKFRITKSTLDIDVDHTSEDFGEESRDFLVVPKSVQLLHSCIDGEEKISLNFEQSKLILHTDTKTLILRYGEGTYPNYENIIPKSYTCHFVGNVLEFRESLKQVYLTARTNTFNKSITMEVIPDEKVIIFSSRSEDGFESESKVDLIEYEGVSEKWQQAFNADYLIDYIGLIDSENIEFDANPGKPMVMSPSTKKRSQICMIQGLR